MAHYSLRKDLSQQDTIITGEKDLYEPVSREVFWEAMKEQQNESHLLKDEF